MTGKVVRRAQTPISFIHLSKHKQAGFILTNSIMVTFPAMVKLTNFATQDKNVKKFMLLVMKNAREAPNSELITTERYKQIYFKFISFTCVIYYIT